MNARAIRAIVRKDLKVVTQSRSVLLPLIIVPILMLALLPAGVALAARFGGEGMEMLDDMGSFMANLPAGLRGEVASLRPEQQIVHLALLYFMAPFYLIVPLMVASVIAADSFAGEKERKTLEALLYTPTTDQELMAAKLLAAWLPAVAVSWLGFALYGAVANVAAWPLMGRVFFPNGAWLALAFWVAPAAAGLGLSLTVLVSSRVRTFQEAYQLSGLVVLPLVAMMLAQAAGVIYLSLGLVVLLGLLFWLVDAALLWYGARTLRRSEILARL